MARQVRTIYPLQEGIAGNLTDSITVGTDQVAHIKIRGLHEGDYVLVESKFEEDSCGGSWEPFSWDFMGCPDESAVMRFDYPVNNFMIPIEGRYRLVFRNKEDLELTDPTYFDEVVAIYTATPSPKHDISGYF